MAGSAGTQRNTEKWVFSKNRFLHRELASKEEAASCRFTIVRSPETRFSGLEASNSMPIRFIWNPLPMWLKPQEKPVRNGLEFYHCSSTNQPQNGWSLISKQAA